MTESASYEVKFSVPKNEWGDGPWNGEPDREEFEAAGFACLALRNHWGVWCGYVGVPPGHPAYGKPFSLVDIHVHGGLTYADECDPPICHVPKPGEPDDLYWLGFDCGHFMDLSPGMEAFQRRFRSDHDIPPRPAVRIDGLIRETYRDLEYVRGEIRSLAGQLAGMATSKWKRIEGAGDPMDCLPPDPKHLAARGVRKKRGAK